MEAYRGFDSCCQAVELECPWKSGLALKEADRVAKFKVRTCKIRVPMGVLGVGQKPKFEWGINSSQFSATKTDAGLPNIFGFKSGFQWGSWGWGWSQNFSGVSILLSFHQQNWWRLTKHFRAQIRVPLGVLGVGLKPKLSGVSILLNFDLFHLTLLFK